MATKPRTTKKPTKAPRKPRQAKPTAEEIGRSIGDVLGRKLDDLLAGRDVSSAAVHAWTAERVSETATGYHTNTLAAAQAPAAKMKPVEEALYRLRDAILMAETCTESETERLASALSMPTPIAGVQKMDRPTTSHLAGIIHDMADRVFADNFRRNDLLERLEL